MLGALMAATVVAFGAQTDVSQGHQSRLAQALARDTPGWEFALAEVGRLDPASIGPELQRALIQALSRQGQLMQATYMAWAKKAPRPGTEPSEAIIDLVRIVGRLDNPAAIPALVSAMGTGPATFGALARFGNDSVEPIAAAVVSPDTMPEAISDGLIALRFLIETSTGAQLSRSSVQRIRDVAAFRLRDPGMFARGVTLADAIDLATTLKDPALFKDVEAIARDSVAVTARGVSNQRDLAAVQQHARDRLAGLPPLPRPPQ